MTQSNKSISPLRQRMLDDMALRKLSPKTQRQYVRAVKDYASCHDPTARTGVCQRRERNGRLSRPGFTDQADDFAMLDGETHIVDDRRPTSVGRAAFDTQVMDLE